MFLSRRKKKQELKREGCDDSPKKQRVMEAGTEVTEWGRPAK